MYNFSRQKFYVLCALTPPPPKKELFKIIFLSRNRMSMLLSVFSGDGVVVFILTTNMKA